MTAQKSHQLSQAQAYYLHALGVDLYGLKDADEQVSHIALQASQQKPQQESIQQVKQTPSLEAVKQKLQAKTNQQSKSQSLQSPKTHEVKTPVLKAPVLVMTEQAFKQSTLVADLCVLFGVDANQVKSLGDDYFQIGAIKWRFVEQVDRTADIRFKFADNKLISEPLSKLTDVKVKRALWSALMSTL